MKKIIALLVLMVMVLGIFAACGSNVDMDSDQGTNDQIQTEDEFDNEGESNGNDDEGVEDDKQDIDEEEPETSKPEANKPEANKPETNKPETNKPETNKPEADKPAVGGQSIGDLKGLVSKIYDKTGIDQEIKVETFDLDLTNEDFVLYNLGLSDASDIKEAVVSEAMITTQAYSMVLARVKDGVNAQDVAKEIKKGADPRKWICVMADDVKVAVYGDVVLLVMINSNMDDFATSKTIVGALNEISGIKGNEI